MLWGSQLSGTHKERQNLFIHSTVTEPDKNPF